MKPNITRSWLGMVTGASLAGVVVLNQLFKDHPEKPMKRQKQKEEHQKAVKELSTTMLQLIQQTQKTVVLEQQLMQQLPLLKAYQDDMKKRVQQYQFECLPHIQLLQETVNKKREKN